MRRIAVALGIGLLGLGLGLGSTPACGGASQGQKADPEPTASEGGDETPPGVKPRHVPCDPVRPEMPCTPEPEGPEAR